MIGTRHCMSLELKSKQRGFKMIYVYYKFDSLSSWQKMEFENEGEAFDEALELLRQGYIVQVEGE